MAEPAWLSSSPVVPADPGPDWPAPPGPGRSWPPRYRRGLLTGVLATVVLGVLCVFGYLVVSRAAPAPESDLIAVQEVSDSDWCVGLGSGEPASVDSSDPGAAAIAGFEWGYYVARDGARARDHVAPDARVGSAERLEREGIAKLPVGTTHCVLTKQAADGLYIVDVWERRPDGSTRHFPQTIRTRVDGDRALITSITVRE